MSQFCKDDTKCKETLLITNVYYVCVQMKVRIAETGSNQLCYRNRQLFTFCIYVNIIFCTHT